MNLDGCRNCKYQEFTGMAKIRRCSLDSLPVNELNKCGNFVLSIKSVGCGKKSERLVPEQTCGKNGWNCDKCINSEESEQ